MCLNATLRVAFSMHLNLLMRFIKSYLKRTLLKYQNMRIRDEFFYEKCNCEDLEDYHTISHYLLNRVINHAVYVTLILMRREVRLSFKKSYRLKK